MSFKQKIIGAVIAIGVILITIFASGLGGKQQQVAKEPTQETQEIKRDSAIVVSTNPTNLENATLLPNQAIELNFSLPLENEPELKREWVPEDVDIKAEISADKKNIKFIPNKPLKLGTEYTLIIKQESKFEGGKRLDKEYVYHIKTINYSGV